MISRESLHEKDKANLPLQIDPPNSSGKYRNYEDPFI